MFSRIFLVISLVLTFYSCSKDEAIYNPKDSIDPYMAYKEGIEAFEQNNFFLANKKFSEAELNFKNVEFAAKAAIMSSFSLYGINFYNDAIVNLERYLKKYPADKNVIYAHYLIAIVYFEQIEDEKKDLKPLLDASKKIDFFLNKYPNTDYSIDLKFKKT